MIHLLKETADQKIYVSLAERWKDFGQPLYYKVLVKGIQSTDEYEFTANVTGENERFTEITVSTAEDGELDGIAAAEYEYLIYGTNNLSLQGTLFERGLLKVMGGTYTDAPTLEPVIIVNYE